MGILAAGMVRSHEEGAVGQGVDPTVAKGRLGAGKEEPPLLESFQASIEGDLTQRDHHLHVLEQLELLKEVGVAVGQLFPGRPVAWRGAADHGGYVEIGEPQAVFPVPGGGLIGEAEPIKGLIQKIAALVPGEHPPGPVPSMGGGGQANDQNPGPGISKAGHRFSPVFPLPVLALLFPGDLLPMRDQPGTSPAGNDLFLELR